MFKPARMTKITVIGAQSHLPAVIDNLHNLKVLHIIEHSKQESLDIGAPLEISKNLSDSFVKLRATMTFLGLNLKEQSDFEEGNLNDILSQVDETISKVEKHRKEIEVLNSENKILSEKIEKLDILEKSKISPEELILGEKFKLISGFVKDKSIIQEIKKATKKHDVEFIDYNGRLLMFMVIMAEEEKLIQPILPKYNFIPFSFDIILSDLENNPQIISKTLREKIKDNKNKINKSELALISLKEQKSKKMLSWLRRIELEQEKATIPLKFGVTEKAFVITGYIPTEEIPKVQSTLNKAAQNTILIQTCQFEKKDSIPIKFKHPKIINPFEFLLKLYTLPNYKEIDPTFFTFITFPFLFGFMLGDIGYGLFCLALFIFLRHKIKSGRPLFNILIWASVFTVLMGLVFGEFFGAEELGHFAIPHLLSRSHEQMGLLYLSLIVGVVHLNIGLIIGFINELKHHGFKHALFAKISWIVLQAGVGLLLLKINIVGYAIIGLAILMLVLGEGFRGVIELPSIFGNILSYARLMALGLASVSLAEIINEFAGEFMKEGIGGIIAALLILIFGHGINIALGILGPFLHSLRLHYVEFFSKFYQGGGVEYKPFGSKE